MSQLKIAFSDGSNQIIRVSNEFFQDTPMLNTRKGKMEVLTAEEKAVSLAQSIGRPYEISLFLGNELLYHRVFAYNTPPIPARFVHKNDSKVVKKLHNKWKNIPFHQTIGWSQLAQLNTAARASA